MSVRKTMQAGNPVLKADNEKIVDFAGPKLAHLITDLKDTMYAEGLIGIAAPQIGENYMIFVTGPRETDVRPADQSDEFRVYVNPRVVWESEGQVVIWEGCGSVKNAEVFGPITRPVGVEVEAFDADGKKFRFKADGILGRVIQHELDHLNGREFTDLLPEGVDLKSKDYYIANVKNRPDHLVAQKITTKEYHDA